MCLHLAPQPIKAETAKEDIPVWKVLEKNWIYQDFPYNRTRDGWTTPYRGVKAEPGTTMKANRMPSSVQGVQVHKGIHTYGEYPRVLHFHQQAFPAVIPKGAKYYVGTHNGELSFASSSIKILKPRTEAYNERMKLIKK